MITVRDLMTPEPSAIEPEMTLREAVEWLASEGYGGAPVVSQGRLVGVVSATDLLEFESTHPGIPSARDLGGPESQAEPADGWDGEDQDPPSGWFRDMWADSAASLTGRFADPSGPEWDFLSEHTVAEVMTRRVITLDAATGADEAAGVMVRGGVHRVLVTEGDALVGILTSMDLVRAVADGKLR